MGELEERYQVDLSDVKFSDATTIGEVEALLRNPPNAAVEIKYPRWPQNWLVTALRIAVYYLLVWPATYLLAAPRIRGREYLRGINGPVLVVSNHVTYVDIGWILAALPARFRHRLATAMRGERIATMLRPPAEMGLLERFSERLSYFLVFGLFNVFPLPREAGFRRSFAFAGDLADRGWNSLIFPEGITTPDGRIAALPHGNRFAGKAAQAACGAHSPGRPFRHEKGKPDRASAGAGAGFDWSADAVFAEQGCERDCSRVGAEGGGAGLARSACAKSAKKCRLKRRDS